LNHITNELGWGGKMANLKKRFLVLSLVLFCFSFLFAGEFSITKKDNGTCTIRGYDGENENINIPNKVDECLVTSIGDYAFWFDKNLESIIIPETVTSIGKYAFSSCDSLNNIYLPQEVAFIGEGAFSYCSSLEFFQVDKNNKNYAQIQGVLFNKRNKSILIYPCNKEQSFYSIPDGIKHIEIFAFSKCQNLMEIIIPNSVFSIGDYSFTDCDSLKSITIPNSVSSIGKDIFEYCYNLKEINVVEGSYAYNFFQDSDYSHLLKYNPSWL